MKPAPEIKIAVASGSEDLIGTLIERMNAIRPDLPLYVISEFRVDGAQWIPYHLGRSFTQNLAACRSALAGKTVSYCGIVLQPRMPYWRMRLLGLVLGGVNTIFFNEQLDHFMLRPGSAGNIARYYLWRAGNLVRWELRPGGGTYTLFWRLRHPRALARPLRAAQARFIGWLLQWEKHIAPRRALRDFPNRYDAGISVVIPSRNGRDLLERLLPGLLAQLDALTAEVLVVDNGSGDGTREYLQQTFPQVRVLCVAEPLSFSQAINRGVNAARYDRLLMLNNDMVLGEGFFPPLFDAFGQIPDLFCATAQIRFPPGVRREETGKAAMPAGRAADDFPVTCELPLEGETLTPVLYGSGGCSLFDTHKLARLGGLDEIYSPAYVEDLDLGVRGWRQGWPSVFVAGAQVEHRHRATTSRYYTPAQLERVLAVNYLKFAARVFTDPATFAGVWRRAIHRLNLRAARQTPEPAAVFALSQVGRALAWTRAGERAVFPEQRILAAGSGDIANFPGREPTGRPVVVIASPYIPFPLTHGGAVRMYNLMREAARDFDLVLLTFVDMLATPPEEVLALCVETVLVRRHASHLLPLSERPTVVDEFDSEAFRAALQLAVKRWRAAIVQLEFTQMALYASSCAPARTVLVEHDITLDLYAQLLERNAGDWETAQQHQRWERFERAAWRTVDTVVAMSEKDRRGIGLDNAVSLPNGVDLARFQPSAESPDAARLLFIGSFAHLPNVLAIDYFLRHVWPLIRAELPAAVLHTIAGSRHRYYLDHYRDRADPPFDQPNIEIDDFVADPRPAYRRAAVVIAPLLASAGTNIKIMEAMAMGKAVVSTPSGINGLDDLRADIDLLVARTAAAFAAAVVHLMRDPQLRARLESQAHATVTARYGWDAIGQRQTQLYRRLLASTG